MAFPSIPTTSLGNLNPLNALSGSSGAAAVSSQAQALIGSATQALAGSGPIGSIAAGALSSAFAGGNPLAGAAQAGIGILGQALGPVAGPIASQLASAALGGMLGKAPASLAGAATGATATGAAAAGGAVNCSPPAGGGGSGSGGNGNGQGDRNVANPNQTQAQDYGNINRSDSPAIRQLESNPELRSRLYAYTEAEVGGQGSAAQQAFMASVVNRADARGVSVDSVLSNNGYWPPSTINNASLGYNASQMESKYGSMYSSVAGGSNVCNYCTGNASGSVGFGGGPRTSSYNGEYFGIENNSRDTSWASSRGYRR